MVEKEFIPIKGIKVARYYWGCIISGTREALVAHGYAQPAPFPGDPGANKWCGKATDPEGRTIKLKRKSKQTFEVWLDWSEEEAADYQAEEERRRAQQEEIERASRLVESWPKSAPAFREEAQKAVEFGLLMIEGRVASGSRGGYRYDDDTQLRFRILSDQLIALIESGTVIKDLALREEHTPECIAGTVRAADAARRDKAFQQFIQGVTK